MRSETALRSRGGVFFFAFLKHNFPSIALGSTGESHSYKLGPSNGGGLGSAELQDWIF